MAAFNEGWVGIHSGILCIETGPTLFLGTFSRVLGDSMCEVMLPLYVQPVFEPNHLLFREALELLSRCKRLDDELNACLDMVNSYADALEKVCHLTEPAKERPLRGVRQP